MSITDPIDVARIAFSQEDGVLIGDDVLVQSYVDSDDNGTITVDVNISDQNLEGGGAFRYRVEYIGPADE